MKFLLSLRPGIVGLGLGLVLAACSRQAVPPEPIRAVKLLQVQAHAAQASRSFAAEVRAQTEARLGFRVPGKLLQRPAQLGQAVSAGQLLAQLDAQDYALGAQAAQAQVQAAQTQRDLAQADWQRFSALQAQGFISPVELDRRRAQLEAAQAQLQQAKAQATVQGNQNHYTQLRSDAAGVVTGVHAEPGQVVAAGAPVLTVALDGPRDAVFAVPEGFQAQLTVGQTVQVQPWGDGAALAGQVREVAASADPVTRTFLVKVALPPAAGGQALALGSTVQVVVPGGTSMAATAPSAAPAEVLTLPSSAVWQQAQGGAAVWVFDAPTSTVRAQTVQLGGVQGNALVVRSGLQAGQQVVAAGTHVLTEGQKVLVYQGQSHGAVGVQP